MEFLAEARHYFRLLLAGPGAENVDKSGQTEKTTTTLIPTAAAATTTTTAATTAAATQITTTTTPTFGVRSAKVAPRRVKKVG